MLDHFSSARVETAGGQQDRQKEIRTLDDVPARYRAYPDFEKLTDDPAHRGDPNGKVLREAMAAAEADLSRAVKGPVTRSDTAYIDFYDGDGHPYDVKTPLSPSKGDKWAFDPASNAETILRQLDMEHPNKKTGAVEPVSVLIDTTYMTPKDRLDMWRELRKRTKENRSVLNNVREVNVKLDKPRESRLTALQILRRQRTER